MKLLIIYYTGTFNTRYLVNKVKDKFLNLNYQVDVIEVNSKSRPVDLNEYDLLGISYPIYGFNSPLPLNQYLKSLRYKKGLQYFIFKNSGETLALNNASSRVIKRVFYFHNMKLIGEYHFILPYNIHFKFEDDLNREILDKDRKLLEVMMHNIQNHKIAKINSNPLYDLISFIISIQKLGGPLNSYFYKIDDEKCIGCGLCVQNCPSNNIYIDKDKKIKFHHHCDMCMRCSFFCPKDAISIGMLNPWKVNGGYDFKKLETPLEEGKHYITNQTKGFNHVYIKSFNKIELEYSKIKDGYEPKLIK